MLKLLLLISLAISVHASSLKKADRYYKNNNTQKATKYYKKACDEGIKEGCDKYNELQSPVTIAFTLISQHRGEEAMPYLKQACKEGFDWACTMYQSATGESVTVKSATSTKNIVKIVNHFMQQKMTEQEAVSIALRYTWGKPILSNLKYDSDNKYFLADLKFDRKKDFHKKVTIAVSLENTKAFKTAFSSLKPQAVFNYNNGKVKLKNVEVPYSGKNYRVLIKNIL